MTRLTAAQARRVAVAAQGFTEPRPAGAVTRAHLRRLISRIQVLQLDSVSVAVRAHYAPVFSRLGPYDRDVLDRAAWGPARIAAAGRVLGARGRADGRRRLAAAALADAPVPAWPLGHAHRQGQPATRRQDRRRRRRARAEHRRADRGASGRRAARAKGQLVGSRSDTKWVAEALFAAGVLTTATRVGFARHYDLVERVLPAERAGPRGRRRRGRPRAHAAGGHALGVATEADIRDYFRLSAQQVKPAIAELVADGEIERVDVDGWSAPAYLRAGRTVPRAGSRYRAAVPVRPVDLLRPRVERLFDFHYRIEIYTPAGKRQYGYYVWPLLLDGRPGRAGRPQGRPGRGHAARGRRVR